MGTTNLFVLGRKSKFDITVQRALVQSVCEQEPDLVLITGDFTAQALELSSNWHTKSSNPYSTGFQPVWYPAITTSTPIASKTDKPGGLTLGLICLKTYADTMSLGMWVYCCLIPVSQTYCLEVLQRATGRCN